MKLLDPMNKNIRKDVIYESYYRLFDNPKDYEKISRTKMLEEILEFYSDYNNIIDICTIKELKFLEYLLNNDFNPLKTNEYLFEIDNLIKKRIIGFDNKIFDELKDNVKLALKKVNYKEKEKEDRINEILIGYIKTMGDSLIEPFLTITSLLISKDDDYIFDFINKSKLFKFYVLSSEEYIESIDKPLNKLIYIDYYDFIEDIDYERSIQAIGAISNFNEKDFINIFYYDFNINNKVVGDFISLVKKTPYASFILDMIKETTIFNMDRELLIEEIYTFIADDNISDKIIDSLDKALDRVPSPVLNGMTPLECEKKMQEKVEYEIKKEKEYIPQKNACIGKNKAKEFYKIYFGLLEYTNRRFKVNTKLKIYKRTGIDPSEIQPVTEKFWENKDSIINDFLYVNPFKFKKEELKIVKEFKKGKYGTYIISKYDEEYTEFISEDRIYMVKGITCNIDEIINFKLLPYPCKTALLEFNNNIIFDGIIGGLPFIASPSMNKALEEEKESLTRYYHL